LQFGFTLAKPWLSKDDDPFYVADAVNPVRKDKVFKVPVMAASSWKGLLRWAVMQVHLVERKDELASEEFAGRRLAHTLLFGDEKGEEPDSTKDFSRFLDNLKPDAKDLYRQKARQHFKVAEEGALPHHSGRLICYSTFFNSIDVEVINPHSRKTRAGAGPIYLECVPTGAKGTFTLLYIPFDLIAQPGEEEIKRGAKANLQIVAEAIKALMLIYGFSAKRTSGFGAAEDSIDGMVQTRGESYEVSRLSTIPKELERVRF
jgi:CRISPR-associated protein Cmr2